MKEILGATVLVALFVTGGMLGGFDALKADAAASVTRWEYIAVQYPLPARANELGAQGWEMVAVNRVGEHWFKRRRPR